MRTYEHSAGEGECRIQLVVTATEGHGLSCLLTGGTLPHVGGHALACPDALVGGMRLSSCDLWTSTVPGHKDVEAAAAVARKLCMATGEPVSVTAGIHVDDATPKQLQALLSACESAADDFLAVYLTARSVHGC